ncbi:MAG: Ig-like domain-containing protein [Clostridia bacterium]|nr:Ig-like domain-containing protein [Clostridia bacterium]
MSEKKTKVDVTSEAFEQEHEKQAKWLYAGVIGLLILIFVVIFTYGLFAVTALEGQMDMSESVEADIQAPKSADEAYNLIMNALDKAIDEKPKLRTDHGFQIDDSSINTEFGTDIIDTYNFVKAGINDTVKQDYDFQETDYFADITDILKIPDIAADDIESFEVNYITYKCRSCGIESDKQLQSCDSCGCDYPYREVWKDDFEVVLHLRNTPEVLKNNFITRSEKDIMKLFEGKHENLLTIDRIGAVYENLSIKAIVNRNNGKITYLSYEMNPTVRSNLTFKNDFESLSSSYFDFSSLDIEAYNFTWPAINLSSSYMQVGFKENSSNIQARLICDDPTEKVITWVSSDPSICEVDKDGYLKTHKQIGQATITASFEFEGHTYSSECTVDVRESVTGVQVNHRSKTLAVGETFQLEAKVKPSDATVKNVKWYSVDHTIATIDENGLVTAVSPGTIKVFALTEDGSYRSSCEVTVK